MKKLALSAALSTLAAAFVAGPALAADTETLSVTVPVGDLDLTTPAGQATLDQRINGAVKDVCARPGTAHDMEAVNAWLACRKGAAASAAEQLGAADLQTEIFALL